MIRKCLQEFRAMAGRGSPSRPMVVAADTVRRCLRLLVEEVFETIDAACQQPERGENGGSAKLHLDSTRHQVFELIDRMPIAVDLPTFADGLVDLAYVGEDAAQEFGINTEGVLAVVHAANMAKGVSDKLTGKLTVRRRKDGKILKPEGWAPPAIAAELERQGWGRPPPPSNEDRLRALAERAGLTVDGLLDRLESNR